MREFVGYWRHTREMRATTRLPIALGLFHLLPASAARFGAGGPSERYEATAREGFQNSDSAWKAGHSQGEAEKA